ncbi:ALP1-like protein [Tanacetum coccineum]
MKCTSAVRQLSYGCVPDSLNEYLQMGATTARDSLRIFCKVIMNLYEEFLRKPTYTDMKKLYAYHYKKHGRAPDVPFVANDVPYKRGYYLTDRIYPQCKERMERAFGVLKKKWKIIKYPARGLTQSRLSDIMYTCLILHNMIIHDKGKAICPDYFPEEQHRADDPEAFGGKARDLCSIREEMGRRTQVLASRVVEAAPGFHLTPSMFQGDDVIIFCDNVKVADKKKP